METLLIIIGLIVVLRYVSKGLIHIGNVLENIAEKWDDRNAANFKTPVYKREKRENIFEKDPRTKEELTDEEFNKKIKNEIDLLTGGQHD